MLSALGYLGLLFVYGILWLVFWLSATAVILGIGLAALAPVVSQLTPTLQIHPGFFEWLIKCLIYSILAAAISLFFKRKIDNQIRLRQTEHY